MKNFLKVSTRGHYGLVLMVYLAQKFCEGGFISLKEISENENLSEGYLEEIVSILKKNKLVRSHRGKSGGYQLFRDPNNIKILNIIEILEGPLVLVECLGGKNKLRCYNKKCVSKKVWREIQKELLHKLKSIKLGDFV